MMINTIYKNFNFLSPCNHVVRELLALVNVFGALSLVGDFHLGFTYFTANWLLDYINTRKRGLDNTSQMTIGIGGL